MRTILAWTCLAAAACGSSAHSGRDAGVDSGGVLLDAGLDATEAPLDAGIDAAACVDGDGDGHADDACGGDDCDDGDATVHPGVREDEEFQVEIVDEDVGTGVQVALAVGSDGLVHAAYAGPDPVDPWYTLRVATLDAVGWRWELITRQMASDLFWPAIAAESGGTAHVIWAQEGLQYATNATGEWESQLVDAAGSDGQYGSIALDDAGAVHATYRALVDSQAELRYATDESGDWEVEVADAAGRTGGFTSIALSEGVVHVVFERGEEVDDLLYGRREGGSWTIEPVDDGAVENAHTSLALDPAGAPVVAYAAAELRVATRAADGSWSIETPAPDALVVWDVALAFDRDGGPHVTFPDQRDQLLYLAHRTPEEGWIVEEVDGLAQRGRWSSIAFGPDGTMHLAYSDEIGHQLRHAWRSARDGRDQDCDGAAW